MYPQLQRFFTNSSGIDNRRRTNRRQARLLQDAGDYCLETRRLLAVAPMPYSDPMSHVTTAAYVQTVSLEASAPTMPSASVKTTGLAIVAAQPRAPSEQPLGGQMMRTSPLASDAVVRWTNAISGTPAPVALLANRDAFWTYFRQGDTRGSVLYSEPNKSVSIDSSWELGRFTYGGRWQEFSFDLKVDALSFGNLDLWINNNTIKLGDLVAQAKSGTRVRVVYDEATRTINAFVGNSPVRQASVLVDNWNATFNCTLYSGGGQRAAITVSNPTVGFPRGDIVRPVASFSAVSSVVATAVPSVGIRFSEPVTGFDLGDLILTRNGVAVPLSAARLTGAGASYTVTGLGALTTQPGNYSLTLRAAGSGVGDTVGNPLASDAVVRWTNAISGTPAPVALLANRDAFWTYFRQGDTRGSVLYSEPNKSVSIDSSWELGRFTYGGRWQEFSFDLKVDALSFGRFDLTINGTTIRLGNFAKDAGQPTRVRIVYDGATRTLNAFFANSLVQQASVVSPDWNASFKCVFSSNGGGTAKVVLANTFLA